MLLLWILFIYGGNTISFFWDGWKQHEVVVVAPWRRHLSERIVKDPTRRGEVGQSATSQDLLKKGQMVDLCGFHAAFWLEKWVLGGLVVDFVSCNLYDLITGIIFSMFWCSACELRVICVFCSWCPPAQVGVATSCRLDRSETKRLIIILKRWFRNLPTYTVKKTCHAGKRSFRDGFLFFWKVFRL